MKVVLLLFVTVIAVSAAAVTRITGGSVTTIAQYRFAASMLYGWASSTTFTYKCGGVVVTTNAIVSAAICYVGDSASRWRVRVGSVRADSSGIVLGISTFIVPGSYDATTLTDNIAVIRTSTNIVYNTNVQPANLAASSYVMDVDTEVWAVGWGATQFGGSNSARLLHAAVRTIDQTTCEANYNAFPIAIDVKMVCVGEPIFGGRGQCSGDEGSALVRKVDTNVNNNVVVGIFSWGRECGLFQFPGVNTLIAPHRDWIITNANS